MSNVVEYPTTEKPITEDEIDKLHSGAFRDLESGISDCVCTWRVSQCRWPSTRSSPKRQCSRCSRSRLC
jgi:hypothetical protein